MFVLRRRDFAGLDEESSVVSCGNDVGDVLALKLEELVDNPGQRLAHSFRVALDFLPCWVIGKDVVSDHWATHANIRDLRRVYPAIRLQVCPR